MLQTSFGSFEPTLPPGAWDNIALKLDNKDKQRKVFFWRWILAAGFAVLLGVGVSYYALKKDQQEGISGKSNSPIIKQQSSPQGESETKPGDNAISQGTEENNYRNLKTNQEKAVISEGVKNRDAIRPDNLINGQGANSGALNQTDNHKPSAEVTEQSKQVVRIPEFDLDNAGIQAAIFMPENTGNKDVLSFGPQMYFPKHSPWSFGVNVMQNQSGTGYSVNPEFSGYVHKNYLKRMAEGERSLGAIQSGFWAAFRLNKKFSLMGGVNYAQRNSRQQFSFEDEVPVVLVPGRKPDKFGNYPIIGYFSPSGRTEYNGFSRITLFEIPVGIMGHFALNRNWTLRPAMTMNFGRIVSETGSTLDYQLLTVTGLNTSWFRKQIITPTAALGITRTLKNGLDFGVFANSSYNATPVYVSGATVRPRTWAVGLGTQLIWTLK